MYKIGILVRIFLAPFVVLSLHVFLIAVVHIQTFWPSFDIPMHLLGGGSIAFASWTLFRILKEQKVLSYIPSLLEFFFLVAITALAAVFWEILEFIAGYMFDIALFRADLADTILDLVLGLVGGFLAAGYLMFFKMRRHDMIGK